MPGSVFNIEEELKEQSLISAAYFPTAPKKYRYTLEAEFSEVNTDFDAAVDCIFLHIYVSH